jgi:hypothetical protein
MASSETTYFPLNAESSWHYEVEVCRSGRAVETLSAVKYVRESQQIGAKKYTRIATDVKGGALRVPDQFYRAAEGGVYAAVQGAEGKELLVLPADPRANGSWSGEALPSIIRFSAEASPGETYQHGALKFGDCHKVCLTMTVAETSFFGGKTETPVRLERWFAPGVGMVRELRIVGEEGKANYVKTDSKLIRFTVP